MSSGNILNNFVLGLYLKLKFSWASCVLSGKPAAGWIIQEANSEMEFGQEDAIKECS